MLVYASRWTVYLRVANVKTCNQWRRLIDHATFEWSAVIVFLNRRCDVIFFRSLFINFIIFFHRVAALKFRMPLCHVSGCNVNITKGVHGHRFPYLRDLELAKRWVILCKIEYGSFSSFQFDGLYVCGKHFRPEDYEESRSSTAPDGSSKPVKKRLKLGAVPTLHMPPNPTLPTPAASARRQRRQAREERTAVASTSATEPTTSTTAAKSKRKRRLKTQVSWHMHLSIISTWSNCKIYYILWLSLLFAWSGWRHITSRHAKGKNRRKYSVRMYVAKRIHRYAQHEGEKWDDFPDVRPSEFMSKLKLTCHGMIIPRNHSLGLLSSRSTVGVDFDLRLFEQNSLLLYHVHVPV